METIKRRKVKDLLQEQPGTEVLAKGWVRTKRGNKQIKFIALNDGSTIYNIQVVADTAKIDEDTLCNLFEQYALAQKVYNSAGTSFEERYDSFCTTLDYDINEKLWNTVELAQIENLGDTPGFSEIYAKYFGSSALGASDGAVETEQNE